MKIAEMIPSSYLKQSDFNESGFIVTIAGLKRENVAPDDKPEENKYILMFKEFDKGLVLNSTNIQATAKAVGSEDTDDWVGKEIIVYVDPTIGFAGKVTGGLRVKRHSAPAAPVSAPKRQSAHDDSRDPPF